MNIFPYENFGMKPNGRRNFTMKNFGKKNFNETSMKTPQSEIA